ncbi:MAG: cytochrome c3 family protein [Acidobacteriota bacterium]
MEARGPDVNAVADAGSGNTVKADGYPVFRLSFVTAFAGAFLLGLWLWPASRQQKIVQPIAFNHQLHGELGLECTDCHAGVKSGFAATLPANSVCADCHEEPIGESAAEKHLVEFLSRGEPIPWQRLFAEPAHVFYSHRRHVAVAGLECPTCHADMGERTEPPAQPPMTLRMNDCLSCHADAGVRDDCTVCHR